MLAITVSYRRFSRSDAGHLTATVVPFSGLLTMWISPPISFARSCIMPKPRFSGRTSGLGNPCRRPIYAWHMIVALFNCEEICIRMRIFH